MEERSDHDYCVMQGFVWRETYEEGTHKFKNVIQSLKEESVESVKKKDLIEYSENKIFSKFKSKTSNIFNKGLLVFDSKTHKLYKVVDLKNNDAGKTTWMSLVLNSGDEQREIKDENEIDDFRDYLLLNLVVSPEKKERTIFQIKQKLYEKLETSITPLFQSIGISSFAMILFFKGKSLDKGGCIAQIENITDGDIIYASEALGKPSIFKRFKEPNNTWFWCNNGCSADGIIFVPTQNVRVCGFTCYAANQKDSYEMKYRVKIDNNSVEEDQITASGWEDKYYFRFRLKGIYDANAGSKIEFTVWIAENLQSQTEVRTYHGDCGDDYETYENEHMGLFKVESSSESDNGTGVYSGHFCEIMYFLM